MTIAARSRTERNRLIHGTIGIIPGLALEAGDGFQSGLREIDPPLSGGDYAISTSTIEWSEIPAPSSTCEYRQDVTRGTSEGVANA